MQATLEKKADLVNKALEDLLRQALIECGFSPREPLPPNLKMEWTSNMLGTDVMEEALNVAKTYLAEQSQAHSGRVYCYFCRQAVCEHTLPEAPDYIFSGYQSTGRPGWEAFFNYLLRVEDPRVDQLFSEHPPVLCGIIERKDLIADQLIPYGRSSLTYLIRGQVIVGYIKIQNVRHAVTIQVVEAKDHRLHVQVIALEPFREAMAESYELEGTPLQRMFDALQELKQNIEALNVSWLHCKEKKGREALKEKILVYLRHFAHSVERKGRQSHRRTQHAEIRSHQNRPVHKAYEDCLEAGTQDLFWDVEKNAVIVLGKRGRVHVYTEEGRHITSLLLERDQIERRQRKNRYLPLEPSRISTFLTSWKAYVSK